jgi:hypothetical protein
MTGKKKDASWFRKHPNRSYRVRWASQEEITLELRRKCPPGFFIAVAVHQVTPGGRVRMPVYWQGTLPKDESCSKALFDWALHGKEGSVAGFDVRKNKVVRVEL